MAKFSTRAATNNLRLTSTRTDDKINLKKKKKWESPRVGWKIMGKVHFSQGICDEQRETKMVMKLVVGVKKWENVHVEIQATDHFTSAAGVYILVQQF